MVRQASRILALEEAETVKGFKFCQFFIMASMILVLIVIVINPISTENLTIQPIRKLLQETQRVANGDFSKVAILQRGDEMGLLSKSFSTMTEKLGALRELSFNFQL
jgi:nitrogen fixation/metabolism regulation signal transduction histidine kinase